MDSKLVHLQSEAPGVGVAPTGSGAGAGAEAGAEAGARVGAGEAGAAVEAGAGEGVGADAGARGAGARCELMQYGNQLFYTYKELQKDPVVVKIAMTQAGWLFLSSSIVAVGLKLCTIISFLTVHFFVAQDSSFLSFEFADGNWKSNGALYIDITEFQTLYIGAHSLRGIGHTISALTVYHRFDGALNIDITELQTLDIGGHSLRGSGHTISALTVFHRLDGALNIDITEF